MIHKLNPRDIFKYLILSIFFGVLYFYVADVSLQVTKIPGQNSAFFIPSGLAIGFLIVFGIRYLPIIYLAKFVMGFSNHDDIVQNHLSCISSISEAYIGLYLYNSFKSTVEDFFDYQSEIAIVSLVAFTAPIFSALIGVTSLYYTGLISEAHYFSHFYNWYVGDALSILIILPVFLSFKNEHHRFFDLISPVSAFFITYIFKYQILGPYLFIIFIAILIPFLFGSVTGIYYSLITIALVLNWFLIGHEGPFSQGSIEDNMISMQFFFLAIALSALALAGFKKTKLIKSAVIPLVIFWILNGSLYYYYYTQKDLANIKIVNEVVNDFQDRLTEKMNYYENTIKGAAGFVTGSQSVESDEWADYVKSVTNLDDSQSVLGMTLISRSTGKTLVYPESLNENAKLEGLYERPELKQVFEDSVTRKKPLLSPPIKINIPGKRTPQYISFLITPVNKNNQFLSWVVLPIHMEFFFKALAESKYPLIDIDIYDGENSSISRKIYSKVVDKRLRSVSHFDAHLSNIVLAGRPFTINWNETLKLISSHRSQDSLLILFGAIFSIIVSGFILNLKLINLKANTLVNTKTAAFLESEQKFKSLFENSSDAVILFDKFIIDCNLESIQLFEKKSKKDLMSMKLDELFNIKDLDSDDTNFFKNKMHEVQFKKVVKFECFCLRTGLPFYAEINLHYIEVNKKFIYQAVIRDISEREKFEQSLTKSKDLALDAAKAKTHFLSTISHEIKTPLNSVLEMINIILEENPNSDLRKDLETIKYSADSLLHIVNEVLDYNKIESGKIILDKKLFSLSTELPSNLLTSSTKKIENVFHNQRVLLVEDNQVNILVTKKFLEKWGLKVDVAINGLEAVNHARALKYDLILMDLHMPLMDGLEATKKIREFNSETPIIGLSADVMTESTASLKLIGMNDFVSKPFQPIVFFNKLKVYI